MCNFRLCHFIKFGLYIDKKHTQDVSLEIYYNINPFLLNKKCNFDHL